jgi:hypothetical protein
MAIKISNSTIIDDSRNIVNAGIVTADYYYGDASKLSKTFPLVSNVLYVAKNGNDANPGTRLSEPKATIAGAIAAAKTSGTTAGTVIKVSSGTYIENNPIALPDQVSIIGDSLREVTITPQNTGDLFYVGAGNYIAEMSFVGAANTGAIVSFNPNNQRYINQSPYIQNCTNFIPNSTGLRIDGNNALGPLKSMVLDSYTQYNQGGIGCSITNEGYAQLVSMFTICNDVAVYCGSGGACDLTNSNSSFGNYGFVADGVSPLKYTGIVANYASANSDTFELNLSTPTLSISNASYDNTTGILKAYTSTPHNFSVGMGVSIADLRFTCSFEPGTRTYPRSVESGGNGYIFEIKTVAPGRYIDSYNLIQANRQEIIDTSFAEISVVYPTFTNPNPDKCKRDLGYIVDAVSVDVKDFTNQNIILATKSYFDPSTNALLTNGLQGEVPQTITAFHKARDTMKLAITNNLTIKNLSLQGDPTNTDPLSCSNVRDFIDNLVGIITTRINTGNLNTLPLPSVSTASTVFTMNVGIATQPHTYVPNTGTANINVVRPFDGQVVYFDQKYFTVSKISLTNPGSGYITTPTITIDPPSTDWGIQATAVAEINNGSITEIEIVSNGRGYTTVPKIIIDGGVGINTATATLKLDPTYYSIQSSTPISSGICTITVNENLPYSVNSGVSVPFFKQSRVLASGHSFEYIGSGTEISKCLPSTGGVQIQDNETNSTGGGLVVFTSTDQSGNFRIGDGVVINQNTGTISGTFYSKSLFSTMTPFILALGGAE